MKSVCDRKCRGGGILLKELVSARANDNPSRLAAITFTFDGSIYLVCDSPEDFVWLPSDGFERTRYVITRGYSCRASL